MFPRPGRRRLLSFLLALGILGVDLPVTGNSLPRVTAADASADIPGVPLPGPVAAGRLGGAIYDVVYRLTVEPGHVIVASLTGAASTDFDLYLFDESATTVLSTTGLLTKSAGPTSTESISWPSRAGGVYYIDLNGATDVEGDFRLTVQTIPDPTPPMASIVLASGRTATNQLTVPVTVRGVEDLSGIAAMAFSLDGRTFEDWQPYQSTTTYTFTAGDGARNLWVKVRNGVGLESMPATDSVVIDTVGPSVVTVAPAPGTSVASLRPPITITFNEPIDPASWATIGLIVQSPSGSLVPGTYSYNAAMRQGTFVPSISMQPGAVYAVNVGGVRDVAGNDVIPMVSWSVTPLRPTQLTGVASPRAIALGASSRISVEFTGAQPPTTVEMLSTNAFGAFESVSEFELNEAAFSILVAPPRNTTYRFVYRGTFGIARSQVDVPVLVRRSVVLLGRSSGRTSRTAVGATVRLTASIAPAGAGVSVSFRRYRFDARSKTWIYAGSFGRKTDLAGRAVLNWTPTSAGSFYWRAVVASTPDFANNTSPVYRWSVSQ
jgi:hypothetical protein